MKSADSKDLGNRLMNQKLGKAGVEFNGCELGRRKMKVLSWKESGKNNSAKRGLPPPTSLARALFLVFIAKPKATVCFA